MNNTGGFGIYSQIERRKRCGIMIYGRTCNNTKGWRGGNVVTNKCATKWDGD
jgi:hypothetical protein